ncbi:GAF domain-containing protein [Sporobolomyces koalae]|uniref:GAF domain-containing protein n=1 Tax=Sporobolomyces koalae TaxID=500713 RepID=UPI0031732C1B
MSVNQQARPPPQSRKSSNGKLGGVLNALKRVSFTRRSSSESVKDHQASPARPAPSDARHSTISSSSTLARKRSDSSLAPSVAPSSSHDTASLRPPLHRLNSSSPASELPKTWADWTQAYRLGLIDFNDPPEPPSDLQATEWASPGGVLKAPHPEGELARQRAVDSIALLHKKKPKKGPSPREKSCESCSSKNAEEEEDDFRPKEMPTHAVLEELAKKAQQRFNVETASVSLMDRDQQLFLAKRGFLPPGDVMEVERQETCCSHTILKATSTGEKEPFVVLDFSKDWRFKTNTYGPHTEGFYAAAPILLPSALGDGDAAQAGGVFCVLGKNARSGFSAEDRLDLERMADEASREIQKWAEHEKREKKQKLDHQRKTYKKEMTRTVSQGNNLDTVDELPTPPLTPDPSEFVDPSDPAEPNDVDLQTRRPSLAESAHSEKSLDLKTTSETPAFPKRRGRRGVHALPVVNLPQELQAVIDLSTQLVAESIEMDFSYVIAIDLAALSNESFNVDTSPNPLRYVAVHGMPVPPPLLSIELHTETLTSPHNALLYVNNDFAGVAGEFSTGLVVKIGTIGNTGYALGTFTEDSRRVLNQEDLLFLRSFGRDIGRQLQTCP